jgi:oxygen-dependent protoporphyrinogen oxidase
MIGSLNPAQKKVVVIGAGISGLLIAYTLKKRGFTVRILEASNRVGGLIGTLQTPYGIAERAAHSLLVTPEAKELFKELRVELYPINKDANARYIYRNGKMRRMPLTFFELIRTVYRLFSKPKKPFDPETGSLADWGIIYLGSAATQYLLAPFITGIFASSPSALLAKIAFPKLIPALPNISLFRHLRSGQKNVRPQMMAPKDGMEMLVQALQNELKDNIETGVQVSELPDEENIVLTVPTSALSKLIRKSDSQSAEALLKVKYAPLITATCFFRESAFSKVPSGVGVLIPRGEGLRMLGCLFNSSSFPERTKTSEFVSLTVMVGGTEDAEAMSLSDDELRTLIDQELHILLQTRAPPTHVEITRWERAIPVYSRDLKSAQDSLKIGFCAHPGRIVFNNFSKEVSIRGLINASLYV